MTNSDKELITSDGQRRTSSLFCMAHMKRKRMLLMILLSLVGVLTLVVMFGIYAAFRVYGDDFETISIDPAIDSEVDDAVEFLRHKRAVNEIIKHDGPFDNYKNVIKRDTDNENIESFLDIKYRELNKNDASEEFSHEEESFIQKRSNDLRKSILKLERVININENLKSLSELIDDSDETANMIAKDIDDVAMEIQGLDEDIVGLIETARLTDNSIHKRIRHKRETDFTADGLDPVAIEFFTPKLEEKRREKRLVQQKLAEVRDEFIRCKKAAPGETTVDCDGVYHQVMDRFREITKKFKEIEEIVDEMEQFNPSTRSVEPDERKKKHKKKKDKKKSSEESDESSEEKKKKKKTSTVMPESTTTATPVSSTTATPESSSTATPESSTTAADVTDEPTTILDPTTEDPTTLDTTTIIDTTTVMPDVKPSPRNAFGAFMALEDDKSSSTISSRMLNAANEATLQSTITESCPASAFDNDVRAHPQFQEDLDGAISPMKFYENHHNVDHLVERKFERSQRDPVGDFVEIADDARVLLDDAQHLIKDVFKNTNHPYLGKAQSSFKSSDVSQSSEPFMALCDQMKAKQATQSQQQMPQQPQQQSFINHNTFAPPVVVPVTAFGSHVPPFQPTSVDTGRGSSMVNSGGFGNMMPYPVCFVNYPQNYRMPQPYFYPGMIPQQPITQPGAYFVPSAPYNMRPVPYPMANQQQQPAQPQQGYRENSESDQATYCTFLANNNADFPAHYSETTETPTTRKPVTDAPDLKPDAELPSESEDRANAFNIPTQFDIIYATYPNQLFAMNHSAHHHHCNSGKIPCFNSNQCVAKSSWCDSKIDCLDASDETACSCKARLAENRICDGFIDCPMGSDELGCFGCDKFQYSCHSNRMDFEANGPFMMCYSSVEKCDGFTNCRNGKDELECSMIVRNPGAMLSYTVSSSEGILHRNFKGRWYPVCKNPGSWAIEACEMEVGKLNIKPLTAIETVPIPGPFLIANQGDSIPTFTDNCQLHRDSNQVIFVKCPQPQCGVSRISEQRPQETRENANSTRHQRDAEERIVGGFDALPMEFPFIVAIYKDGNFHCGGSIYNEHWIITAAHCTKNFELHYFEVWAGILRRSSFSPSAQITKVSHVIRHPNYERATMINDIALMRMKTPFTFNRWVRPICMPAKERLSMGNNWKLGPAAGTLCSTLGWGALREKGSDPDELKVVEVPIISKCKYSHDQEGGSICAGETFGTRDACQGDSGGPLVCKSSNNPLELYLSGIVSHGEGCARANEPGVYTRVSLYIDWIRENTDTKQPLPLIAPQQRCPGHTCVWGGNKCIARSQRCDGFVDCLGGEDEIECTINWLDLLLGSNATEEAPAAMANSTSTDPIKVPEEGDAEAVGKAVVKKDMQADTFRCTKISQVINLSQRCDRINDCEDGTDEENCTCKEHLISNSPKLICDGRVDCADSSDEIGCETCNATEFACPHSRTCIHKSLHCNGNVDCIFREDELECVALTDGRSIMLDVDGKPFMHSKGVVTINRESSWRILCDDNNDFHSNGTGIANDVCNVIGFKSAKSARVVEIMASNIKVIKPNITSIDIRNSMTREAEEVVEMQKCASLEIECIPFQSNSFALHPIQHEKIKKNMTTEGHVKDVDKVIFVPVNTTDPTNIIVKPENKTDTKNGLNHLHDFNWPWSVEIFINGILASTGVLLDKSWVLAESSIMGQSQDPLHDNHVVVLVGNTKAQLHIQSPYEQLAKVDCIQAINNSNCFMLHLETPIDFNRHVMPSFLPIESESEPDSRCLAIAMDSKQMSRSLELKIVPDCHNVSQLICYQQAVNSTVHSQCDDAASVQSSAIVCKTKTSGWYPKAFQKLKKSFCDFLQPVILRDLNVGNCYQQIQKIIDNPCEKCQHHAIKIKCETHRCPLGKCLEKHKLCDGKSDCHDNSDEKPAVCHKVPEDQRACRPSEFRCQNGKCIEKTKFCDHLDDCGDKSDEPSECTCFSYLKATDPGKICDGIRHCWDRTDEDPKYCGTDCDKNISFKCGNSAYCIPLEMVCDKKADCPNGADENFCHGLYQYDSGYGYGEVMERSFGIWHTQCFPKSSPPNQDELEALCRRLGFKDTNVGGRVMNMNSRNHFEAEMRAINSTEGIPVEFQMFNATKVIPFTKFSAVQINKGFTIHLRPSKPLAKLVSWDKSDYENCYRMELKCVDQ